MTTLNQVAIADVPWTRESWSDDGLTVRADGRGIIASCPTPKNGGTMECVANARLIAAAPELYEALRSVDQMFSEPGRVNKNAVRDKVRAALAAARGPL